MKKLFNPSGSDFLNERKLIGGNTTNLININYVKYPWAIGLYRAMMANFWIPEKVNLNNDKTDFEKLTVEEKRAFCGILSFLVFLDSLQTNNVPNISSQITAPEVNLALAIQTSQEAVHSQSYSYIIESLIPNQQERLQIYDFWKDNEILLERNKVIASYYQDYLDNPNDINLGKAIIANWILEGIYFYNGFNFFYSLNAKHLMPGTTAIIKYINKDELTHVSLFEKIIKTLMVERPDMINEEIIKELIISAVEQEIKWSKYIIGDKILGMSPQTIEDYTYFIANTRLKSLGIKPLFKEIELNPYRHFEKTADAGSGASSKGQFFETKVVSYNQSSVFNDWDDI